MVAGGGGGGSSGGICIPFTCKSGVANGLFGGIIGGGGGGGQVVTSDSYEVIQDVSYPITIGAGGAGGGFYYDTTNVYYPLQPINGACPATSYCPQIHDRNAGTLRGSNGGNTVFGSIIAYGGGGGGGGMSNQDTYLPPTCVVAAIQACDKWTAKGADGGTGGGSGGGYCETTCCEIRSESPSLNARHGNSIYGDSVSTLRFGTPGVKWSTPSKFPSISYPNALFTAARAFSLLTYATGGGGNNNPGSPSGAGTDICLVTPSSSVACMGVDDWGSGFRCDATSALQAGSGFYSVAFDAPGPLGSGTGAGTINAFMEGTMGENANHNIHMEVNDYLGSLRGKDGYESRITPSPEYYGGGGSVTYAIGNQLCNQLYGAIMSPNSPCYPSPTWSNNPCMAYFTCSFGGRGGGGSICTSMVTIVTASCCYRCVLTCTDNTMMPSSYGVGVCGPSCGTGLPIPGCICPGAGTANCGGGGASFHGGCHFTSSGDTFPNIPGDPCGADTCAYCGYAGGSGTVVIRYPTTYCAATVTGNTPITPQSGYHIYRFNGPGTITFPSS